MIYGKTHQQQTKEQQTYREWLYEKPNNYHTSFAFLPTKLDNGQMVWLQFYKWKPMVWLQYSYYHIDNSIIYKWA